MRRAGLDYHEFTGVHVYENWSEFIDENVHGEDTAPRMLGISTKGSKHYSEMQFEAGDFLIFGPETRGLPDSLRNELGPENLIRIPMLPESRSLNLSNAAAVIVYEAWRQLGFVEGV